MEKRKKKKRMGNILEFIIYERQTLLYWKLLEFLFGDGKYKFKYVQYSIMFFNENLWNFLSNILKERMQSCLCHQWLQILMITLTEALGSAGDCGEVSDAGDVQRKDGGLSDRFSSEFLAIREFLYTVFQTK